MSVYLWLSATPEYQRIPPSKRAQIGKEVMISALQKGIGAARWILLSIACFPIIVVAELSRHGFAGLLISALLTVAVRSLHAVSLARGLLRDMGYGIGRGQGRA